MFKSNPLECLMNTMEIVDSHAYVLCRWRQCEDFYPYSEHFIGPFIVMTIDRNKKTGLFLGCTYKYYNKVTNTKKKILLGLFILVQTVNAKRKCNFTNNDKMDEIKSSSRNRNESYKDEYVFKTFSETSIHGLRFIITPFRRNNPILERVFWSTLVIISIVVTLIIMNKRWTILMDNPYRTSTRAYQPSNGLEFPYVTICHEQLIRYEKVDNDGNGFTKK